MDRILLPFTAVTTLAGVFVQLSAVPYSLRLWVVGGAALVTAVRLILQLTKFSRRQHGGPGIPRPALWDLLKRAAGIAAVASAVSAALVFVDSYHTVRIVTTADRQTAGAGDVRVAAPIAPVSIQLDGWVGTSALLAMAPAPAGPPTAQAQLTVGPRTPTSATFYVDNFAAPQDVVLLYQVDPPHTALTVQGYTVSQHVGVLYDTDIRNHVAIAFVLGGLLWVGGWVRLVWRWLQSRR
ncbi:MAG: hypothetical protein AB1635_20300 [Acidobacteriota bacterium]